MSDIGQELIEATKAVAAESPDHVYDLDTCVYVRDEKPGCLIGHGLWNLKLIDGSFEDHDCNESGISPMADALGLNLDEDEEFWLVSAQTAQDDKQSWGRAIEHANEELAKSLYRDDEDDDE